MRKMIIVKGMHCTSCEAIIKEALTDLEGVKSAKADYKKGEVIVDFDDKKVDEKKMKKAIKDEGFSA